MPNKPRKYLTGPQVRFRYGGITSVCLWRWLHDSEMEFPRPAMVVNGRRLWDEEALDRWDAQQIAAHEESAAP
jgi:predicted DNA-binding transcriptional regulator AlpA